MKLSSSLGRLSLSALGVLATLSANGCAAATEAEDRAPEGTVAAALSRAIDTGTENCTFIEFRGHDESSDPSYYDCRAKTKEAIWNTTSYALFRALSPRYRLEVENTGSVAVEVYVAQGLNRQSRWVALEPGASTTLWPFDDLSNFSGLMHPVDEAKLDPVNVHVKPVLDH